MNSNYQIVVCRYNEDVEWTKSYQNVLIYNRGNKLQGFQNEIQCENFCREQFVFFNHIASNWDTLHDYTIFVQANPWDHLTREDIDHVINNKPDYLSLGRGQSCFNLNGLSIYDSSNSLIPYYTSIFSKTPEPELINTTFYFTTGGCFSASKRTIKKYSKDFYDNIVNIFKNDNTYFFHNNKFCVLADFVFERFGNFIFKDS